VSDHTNGIDTDEMNTAMILQSVAQEIQKQKYGGDAIVVIRIKNAEFEQINEEGGRLSGDVAIGQAATTNNAAIYCAMIRELIGEQLHDADSEVEASWD